MLFAFLIPATVARAAVIRVPADQPTIQAGIDVALPGDTVLVANGTYTGPGNREIGLLGKAITVRSEHGPELCIIDCQGAGRGFICWGDPAGASIEGFTVRNGVGNGGALYCRNSSLTITDSIITGNHGAWGGGLYLQDFHGTVSGNVIQGNTAGSGGGIHCRFDLEGAAITGNLIQNNTANGTGGGIAFYSSDPAAVSGNLLIGNAAANGGGMMFQDTYGFTQGVADNVIAGNSASIRGGGLYFDWAHVPLEGNTITGNTASQGGGIAFYMDYSATISHTILWGNEAEYGSEVWMHADGAGLYSVMVDFVCGDLEGGDAAVYREDCDDFCEFNSFYSIDADPQFCDPQHGDYSIAATSPCAPAQQPDCGLIGALPVGCGTVSAQLSFVPAIGTLPFPCNFTVVLRNVYEGQARRLAGRLDFDAAGGQHWSNWKSGYVNLGPGSAFTTSWTTTVPALQAHLGQNVVTLAAVDATPSPYNQPPYPPAGDTDAATCTVVGLAP
jgi:hypothetical protein